MNAAASMNDVAHPRLVTVKRPLTMLPFAFKQAIADLAKHALIGVQHVAGDFAVVERYPEEISYGHEIVRPLVAEDLLGTDTAEDAQAGSEIIPPGKVGSPRPRTSEGFSREERRRFPSQSRVVMRAPREGRKLAVEPETQPVASRPRSKPVHRPKQIGGGNDRAAPPLKERTVIRSSLVDAIVRGVLKGFAR